MRRRFFCFSLHHRPSRRVVLLLAAAFICIAAGCAFMLYRLPQPSAAAVSSAKPAVSSAKPHAVSSAAAKPAVNKAAWQLHLVNASHPLPSSFSVKTSAVANVRFDSRAAGALQQMISACNAKGNHLMVCSGWRSISLQSSLYQDEIRSKEKKGLQGQKAVDAAAAVVAPPGTSEHNLGLAADLGSDTNQLLDETFAETPESAWLTQNAWQYGFILRYPKGKEKITGIIYEPWHYRYVGLPAAKEIHSQGVCLEEYLA
ncbi:MAG: M15 family metallopeptidase [Oscillospiraceae bacterium]|nr:M15 family metallopeptidase [Oscillospiraceae bacterium]MDD3261338.1 M15 family metallopeptidase [Oscillospiraceae bacterium]